MAPMKNIEFFIQMLLNRLKSKYHICIRGAQRHKKYFTFTRSK